RALVCEVKFASPSAGDIRGKGLPAEIAKEMEAGGAMALSVLTEPKNFKGSVSNLISVRSVTSLPIIMKDIVVSKEQIIAARRLGASAVLLIEEIFTRKQTKGGLSLNEAVNVARDCGVNSIVETHTKVGLEIVSKVDCDIIGLNNRDLNTFKTNIETTVDLLNGFVPRRSGNRPLPLIMSESGYESPEDILKLKERVSLNGSLQPDAFLIGTSIMKSDNIREKVQSFTRVLLS
ncbi:MAG: indole-3-glycerol-phosphate synthase, partial [Nitrososphaerota archaeon]|nr:indole-3-glycerol-phosphate synthase [Nitrososphaerota archaeon]